MSQTAMRWKASSVGNYLNYVSQLLDESGLSPQVERNLGTIHVGDIAIWPIASKRADEVRFVRQTLTRSPAKTWNVFVLQYGNGRDYVTRFRRIFASVKKSNFEIVRTPEDAAARIIQRYWHTDANKDVVNEKSAPVALAPLRANNGRLDTRLVRKVFGLKTMAEIARAAGISRQALDDNPQSPAATSLLEKFERIAELRSLRQLADPKSFRAWWNRPLPSLKQRSPYDAFLAGDLDRVVEVAERVLRGDFSG